MLWRTPLVWVFCLTRALLFTPIETPTTVWWSCAR